MKVKYSADHASDVAQDVHGDREAVVLQGLPLVSDINSKPRDLVNNYCVVDLLRIINTVWFFKKKKKILPKNKRF